MQSKADFVWKVPFGPQLTSWRTENQQREGSADNRPDDQRGIARPQKRHEQAGKGTDPGTDQHNHDAFGHCVLNIGKVGLLACPQ